MARVRAQGPDSATAAMTATAAIAVRDTARHPFLTGHDGLVGAGFLAASAGISVFDPRIARFFLDTSLAHVRLGDRLDATFSHINETTLTVGGLVIYGVGKLTHQETLADIAFHTAESVAAASLTAQVIRGPLGRERPIDVGCDHPDAECSDQYEFHFFKGFTNFKYRAFPSIHSSSGFAAASAISAEVHERDPGAFWYVAIPAYALAMTPGLSRMYLGQHWASDVFSGAFLGTFYGWRIVQYSHAHPTTPLDRWFLGTVKHLQVGTSANGTTVGLGWEQ